MAKLIHGLTGHVNFDLGPAALDAAPGLGPAALEAAPGLGPAAMDAAPGLGPAALDAAPGLRPAALDAAPGLGPAGVTTVFVLLCALFTAAALPLTRGRESSSLDGDPDRDMVAYTAPTGSATPERRCLRSSSIVSSYSYRFESSASSLLLLCCYCGVVTLPEMLVRSESESNRNRLA